VGNLQKPLKHINVLCSARRYKKINLWACSFNCYSNGVPCAHHH